MRTLCDEWMMRLLPRYIPTCVTLIGFSSVAGVPKNTRSPRWRFRTLPFISSMNSIVCLPSPAVLYSSFQKIGLQFISTGVPQNIICEALRGRRTSFMMALIRTSPLQSTPLDDIPPQRYGTPSSSCADAMIFSIFSSLIIPSAVSPFLMLILSPSTLT